MIRLGKARLRLFAPEFDRIVEEFYSEKYFTFGFYLKNLFVYFIFRKVLKSGRDKSLNGFEG